ncbi:MFS transporter, partial [Geminicoccus flavidas]|uniref:MFS transporter n=1 Tax=Geminicoccus flavidas TaxID=2506407 RepID=UPI0013587B91
MLSRALARYLAARDIHYGWVVAATTFLAMLATAGAMGAPGVMIVPLQQEFGWQTADISSALAVRLVLFGLMGPFAAAFMNHYGIRQVVIAALLLILTGLLGSFLMAEIWQLVLLWGVIVGIGTGMTALVLGATVATRWFTRRRGLVVGLMTASNATGQLVFLPLLAALTDAIGWRQALCLVLGMIVLAMLLVLLLMRDRPADLGLSAYGELPPAPPPARDRRLRDLLVSPLAALREAARTQTFWVLFGTFFICGFSTN